MLLINKLERNNARYEEAKNSGKIDDLCIPFCDILNRIGLTTDYCCQGHPFDTERNQNGEHFEIVFSNNLPDAEIFAFMELLNEVGETTTNPGLKYPCGFFYKWYRFIGGILTDTWLYEIEMAHEPEKSRMIQIELERFKLAEQLYNEKKKERENDIFSPWK